MAIIKNKLIEIIQHKASPMKDLLLEERPREKLLEKGAEALSDAELLALFLRTGIKGIDVLQLARTILKKAGSLQQLFDLPRTELLQYPGIGPTKYIEFQAVIALSKRYLTGNTKKVSLLTSVTAASELFTFELRKEEREVFACAFLNNQHQLIAFERLFYGTVNTASVHPREVVKAALKHNASAILLGHNHPSGSIIPSRSDKDITKLLVQALDLIDVRVLDHFIVGATTISMAERGLVGSH